MLIIADDITGAAEIAGIAWRKGLKVNLRLSGHKVATLSGNEDLKTSKPQNLNNSNCHRHPLRHGGRGGEDD